MTAVEDTLRFRSVDRNGKLRGWTRGATNGLGYSVQRITLRVPWAIGDSHQRQYDVFGRDGAWIGVEPDIYWAMKRADADFFGGGQL